MTASTAGEMNWDGYIGRSMVTGLWFGKAKRRKDAKGKIGFVNTAWLDTELAAEAELLAKIDEFERSEMTELEQGEN